MGSGLFSSGHPIARYGDERNLSECPDFTSIEVLAHPLAVLEGDHFLVAVLVVKDPAPVHLPLHKGAFLHLTVREPENPAPVMLSFDIRTLLDAPVVPVKVSRPRHTPAPAITKWIEVSEPPG